VAFPENPTTLHVIVESRQALEKLLDRAIAQLRPAAELANAGIKVTRTGTCTYTASDCADVPRATIFPAWNDTSTSPDDLGNQVCDDD
jgi:hypothetical protein